MSTTHHTRKEGAGEELRAAITALQARVQQMQEGDWEQIRMSICLTDIYGKTQWRTFPRITAVTLSDDGKHLTIEGSDEYFLHGEDVKRITFEELPK